MNLVEAVEKQFPSVVQRIREDERERAAQVAESRITGDGCEACRAAALIAREIRARSNQ